MSRNLATVAGRSHQLRRLDHVSPYVVDAGMAAAIALTSMGFLIRAEGLAVVPFVAAMTVPLIWRRSLPLVAYAVQCVGFVLAGAVVPPVAEFVVCFLAVLCGAYSTGRYETTWTRSFGIVIVSMAPAAALTIQHGAPLNALWFLQLLFAWAVGYSVRRQLERGSARDFLRSPDPGPGSRASALDGLTTREVEVLRLLARGHSNGEMAELLHIGEGTVKTHVGRILHKLGVRDRVQAVVHAYETGLVAPASRLGGRDQNLP